MKAFPWKQITREKGVDSQHSIDNTPQPWRKFANPSEQALAQLPGLWLALIFLVSTAQLLGTAQSLPAPQHRALPLCLSTRALRIALTGLPLQALGPKSPPLACRHGPALNHKVCCRKHKTPVLLLQSCSLLLPAWSTPLQQFLFSS